MTTLLNETLGNFLVNAVDQFLLAYLGLLALTSESTNSRLDPFVGAV